MHIEFLVEEQSCEAALQNLVPKIVGQDVSFKIHAHQGKPDLLQSLPGRLKGYRAWLPQNAGIVVLVDADEEDCLALKARLEKHANDAGLITKSAATAGCNFQVLNRLAIKELEAWFLGDVNALSSAYPGIPLSLGKRAKYRNPDAVTGGTREALARELQRNGYHLGGLARIAAARDISMHMRPAYNRSVSFQAFRDGLREMAKCPDAGRQLPLLPRRE